LKCSVSKELGRPKKKKEDKKTKKMNKKLAKSPVWLVFPVRKQMVVKR
jgi:hypothetical protein